MNAMIRQQTKIYQKWFDNLSDNVQDKIVEYIDRVLVGNFNNCKFVGEGIYEIKIDYQKGYRVYYTIYNNKAYLLLLIGGDKKTQSKDIEFAKEIKNYLKNKGVIK